MPNRICAQHIDEASGFDAYSCFRSDSLILGGEDRNGSLKTMLVAQNKWRRNAGSLMRNLCIR